MASGGLRHLINLLMWPLPPTRLFALRRFLLRLAGVRIARSACFCGRGWIYGRGGLTIGSGTWISPQATVFTHVDAGVEIGDNCDIGPDVHFVVGTHEMGDKNRRAGAGNAKPIVIGNGVWVGASAKILGGVTIHRGAVVAAGSVVTGDVPENVLVAGVPAVIKKMLG